MVNDEPILFKHKAAQQALPADTLRSLRVRLKRKPLAISCPDDVDAWSLAVRGPKRGPETWSQQVARAQA